MSVSRRITVGGKNMGDGHSIGPPAEGVGERERASHEAGSRPVPGQSHSAGDLAGKLVRPDRRRKAVQDAQGAFQISERRVCRALGQSRSTQRYVGRKAGDEESLALRVAELASQYGRYGYRRITTLLRTEGWRVNHKRVERLWRQEVGLIGNTC